MFLDFLFFELKLRFKSVATYCYFTLWVVITFLFVVAPDISMGPGKTLGNGPFFTQLFDFEFCFFGSIVMAAIFGTSILRDFQRDTYQIIFTKPIRKIDYLGGRWAGSLITTLLSLLEFPSEKYSEHWLPGPIIFVWLPSICRCWPITTPSLSFLRSSFLVLFSFSWLH